MKKVLSVLLVLAISFSMGIPAFAADLDQGGIAQTVTGYLYDEEGNRVEVTGHLVETNAINTLSMNDAVSVTYEFNLLATTFESNSVSSPDPSNVSTVYSTINYYVDGSSYLLSSVSGSWTISDSNASVTSATVTYYCINTVNRTQTGSRSVSNNFYVATGFSSYISGSPKIVGANLTLSYYMSSRSWDFTLPNFI